MRRKITRAIVFLFVFLLGYSIGVSKRPIVPMANAAGVIGSNGYLMGWTITKDSEEICEDPYIWVGTKEIECD